MRLLVIAPHGGEQLPEFISPRVDYLAWIGSAIPEPYPPGLVFQRWHDSMRASDLVASHKPDKALVLAWHDKSVMKKTLFGLTNEKVPVLVIESAAARLPEDVDVARIDVRCLPSPSGDDPLSRAMSSPKVALPESASGISVACPSPEVVADGVLDALAGSDVTSPLPASNPLSLSELLQTSGVQVMIMPDCLPSPAAMAIAKVFGAAYWPLERWKAYRYTPEVEHEE